MILQSSQIMSDILMIGAHNTCNTFKTLEPFTDFSLEWILTKNARLMV